MTELVTTESSTAHDRVGCMKAGVHDSWHRLCRDRGGHASATDQSRGARQALRAHYRVARATGEFCRNREFAVATDLDRA